MGDPGDFYDKVAQRFGGYKTGSNFTKEFSTQDPEAVFKALILHSSGIDKKVLDVGCADGRFTLSMAEHFGQIIGIDMSEGMLESAKRKKVQVQVRNVEFIHADAAKTPFPEGTFDLVYSRRGPTAYQEYARVLKPNGKLVGITIGEKDCQEIKEIFGRGQNYGEWEKSVLDANQKELERAGFSVTTAEDLSYNEYYPTYQDLELFLQGVPIFEDFDPVKDKANLEQYVRSHTTPKGIILTRHRIVLGAVK